MKKITALCFAFLMIFTGLTGCGTSKQSAGDDVAKDTNEVVTTTEETTKEADSTASKETKTVSTQMGDIEVPINPQRVVANWYVGDVIGLGMNLVGYNAWAQETMPFYEELTASTKIESWEPEAVMTLDPDLIITYDEADFDKFSSIAPVLVISESDYTSEERLALIGEATGHSEEATALIETFQTKLEKAKETLKSGAFEGKTFSILEDWGSSGEWAGVAYETGSRGGMLVYDYLNLELPDKLKQLIEETGEGRNTLSYEVADQYFGDYVIWFLQEDKVSEYSQTEIFKSIPAVAQGNIVEIPGEYQGLFYYADVVSLTEQLDYMVEKINSLAE